GMRVFDAYLGLYLPPILEKRSEPLTGFISDKNRTVKRFKGVYGFSIDLNRI
ncbi:hypothetical protein ACRCQ6_30745, partial [Pseudomonas aeruginosa]